jgi:hypothetical protein
MNFTEDQKIEIISLLMVAILTIISISFVKKYIFNIPAKKNVVQTIPSVVQTTPPTLPVVKPTLPIVKPTPSVVRTTPQVVQTTRPVVQTTRPVVQTTRPVVQTTPQLTQPPYIPLFQSPSTGINECSSNDANWYGPLQDLSIDSKCVCGANEIKLTKTLSGVTYYKCELNNQNYT